MKKIVLIIGLFLLISNTDSVKAIEVESCSWLGPQIESSSNFDCSKLGDGYYVTGRGHLGDEDDPTDMQCCHNSENLVTTGTKNISCSDESENCNLVCPDDFPFMIGRSHSEDEEGPSTITCGSVDKTDVKLDQCEWINSGSEYTLGRFMCPSDKPFMRGRFHDGDETDGYTNHYCCNATIPQPACGDSYSNEGMKLILQNNPNADSSGWPFGARENLFCNYGTVGVMENGVISWGIAPYYPTPPGTPATVEWYCGKADNLNNWVYQKCSYTKIAVIIPPDPIPITPIVLTDEGTLTLEPCKANISTCTVSVQQCGAFTVDGRCQCNADGTVNSIFISWEDSKTADAYDIYRVEYGVNDNSNLDFVNKIASFQDSNLVVGAKRRTSYTDNGPLKDRTIYRYRMQAYRLDNGDRANIKTDWSNEKEIMCNCKKPLPSPSGEIIFRNINDCS